MHYLESCAHSGMVHSISVCHTKNLAITGSEDAEIKVWDLDTARLIRTIRGHTASVSCVSSCLDDTHILSLSSEDDSFRLWEIDSGKLVTTYPALTKNLFNPAVVLKFVVTPDGKNVISTFNDFIKVWNVSNGEPISIFRRHKGLVMSLAISCDGQFVISGAQDREIKVWDIKQGSLYDVIVPKLEIRNPMIGIKPIAVTPNGQCILFSGMGSHDIYMWNNHSKELVRCFQGHSSLISGINITPDNKFILSSSYDCSALLWDFETGNKISAFSVDGPIAASAFSPIENTILLGEKSGQLHFLRLS
ncbi:MAG: WD40 repeat domain-containing protein [Chloroflexi bacterium]|nr:WD40 repeat domain-containing protein [Chloroflexota bacterium]